MIKIILAEDDSDTSFVLTEILKQAGYEVQTLKDGSQIVDGHMDVPDIFILDQQMPTIDGIALTKFLKVNKKTKHIPVIMISAYPEIKRKADNVGVSDFLAKPFASEKLLTILKKYTYKK